MNPGGTQPLLEKSVSLKYLIAHKTAEMAMMYTVSMDMRTKFICNFPLKEFDLC